MGYVNPDTVHRPSTSVVAPAAWGDTVNDDLNFLNTVLRHFNGAAANWSSGVFLQAEPVSTTAISAGQAITFPVPFTTSGVLVFAVDYSPAVASNVYVSSVTSTGFNAKFYTGSGSQVTSGAAVQFNYLAIGI